MGNERRAHPRFACDLDVEVTAPGQMTLNARTLDVSRNGICMILPAAIRPGSSIQLGLRLLFDGAESDRLALPAQVVWCTPTGGHFQLGATFSHDAGTAQQLDVLLRFLSGQVALPGTESA